MIPQDYRPGPLIRTAELLRPAGLLPGKSFRKFFPRCVGMAWNADSEPLAKAYQFRPDGLPPVSGGNGHLAYNGYLPIGTRLELDLFGAEFPWTAEFIFEGYDKTAVVSQQQGGTFSVPAGPDGWRYPNFIEFLEFTPFPPESRDSEITWVIVEYVWASGSGTDLDTRTLLTSVGHPVAGEVVGWARQNFAGNSAEDFFYRWGGDNTGSSGRESVAIAIPTFLRDSPSFRTLTFELRAFWYSTIGTGNITLEATAYAGGELSLLGNLWSSSGTIIDSAVKPAVITSLGGGSGNDGQTAGVLTIDLDAGTVMIT